MEKSEKRIYNYVSKRPFSSFQIGSLKVRLNAGSPVSLSETEHQQLQNPNHPHHLQFTYVGCSEDEDPKPPIPTSSEAPKNPPLVTKEEEVEQKPPDEKTESSELEKQGESQTDDSSPEPSEAKSDEKTGNSSDSEEASGEQTEESLSSSDSDTTTPANPQTRVSRRNRRNKV